MRIRVPALLLVSSLLSVATAPAADTFKWGGDAEGGAPFVEADPADPSHVRGFDVDIAGFIAEGLGKKPEFVQVAWASIEQSVERGDFMAGLSGIEDRPALRAEHSVSIPYYEFQEVLAIRPADQSKFTSLASLAGHRVATLGGTGAYEILNVEAPKTGLIPVSYDDDVHPYEDLVAGRVDAVLLDNVIAERSLRKTGGFVIQPTSVAVGHYVAVLAKSQAALRDKVNAILIQRMKDGSLEKSFRNWNVWNDAERRYLESVVAAAQKPADPTATNPPIVAAPGVNGLRSIVNYLPALLRAAVVTVTLSCLAMLLAVSVGIGVAAGRVYGAPALRGLLAVYVEVVRGTPVLLQLFVLYYGLSSVIKLPAFAAAVIGLGLNYAAYESEIYRAALEAIARPQLEAARTLGLSEFQILRLVRGPQAFRLALAPMTNDFVALLKDSSLVSVITVVELTKMTAIYATNVGSWFVPGILCAALYLCLSLPLSHFARRLERRWTLA